MKTELLLAGLDDWVHLPEIAWIAKSVGGADVKEDAVKLSTKVIRILVEEGLMEIGEVTEGGFFEWDLSLDRAIERIEGEWLALERDPLPGDVFWLANTSEGDTRAKNLLRERPTESR